VSLAELDLALRKLSKGKVPGIDGPACLQNCSVTFGKTGRKASCECGSRFI
jgi:hypothetical protein